MTQLAQPTAANGIRPWDQRHPLATLALLMLATAGLCLLNAQRMPFMDPDEGRCGLIARQSWLAEIGWFPTRRCSKISISTSPFSIPGRWPGAFVFWG